MGTAPLGIKALIAAAMLPATLGAHRDRPAHHHGAVVFPAFSQAEFRIKAPNGDLFTIEEGEGGFASIGVARLTPSGGSLSSYSAPDRDPGPGIDVNFGRLGRAVAAFRPSGGERHEAPFPGCRGKATTIDAGALVGTIRFRGERGYTSLRATHVPGDVRTLSRWVCSGGSAGTTPPQPRAVALTATCGFLDFAASDESVPTSIPGSDGGREAQQPMFTVDTREQRGRIEISRTAIALGGSGSFTYDDGLDSALVQPPVPFSGSGRFERGPAGSSWLGSLKVDFLGSPGKRLTGPAFAAKLFDYDPSQGFDTTLSPHRDCG